jgi:ethylbenzene dioxygenase beta subunit
LTSIKAPAGSDLHYVAVDWLDTEAELLDDGREREWLEQMVSRDVVYQVPLRQTVERARGTGFAVGTYHLDETYGSLESRVKRNETAYAWAEDPPSRVRHHVSSVRVQEGEDGELLVRSNLLVFRTRQEQTNPQILSCERRDVLRREDGVLRLAQRMVYLDHTVIGTHNLAVFF